VKIVEAEKTKYCAMKLSQIRRRIELNPSFWGELEKFSFFLTVLFNYEIIMKLWISFFSFLFIYLYFIYFSIGIYDLS
jgi:hypothetical protein